MENLAQNLMPIPQGSTFQLFANYPWLPVVIAIVAICWVLPWKGVALWKAARLGYKVWFVILLVVNTLSLLEIIYVLFIAKKYTVTEERTEETK